MTQPLCDARSKGLSNHFHLEGLVLPVEVELALHGAIYLFVEADAEILLPAYGALDCQSLAVESEGRVVGRLVFLSSGIVANPFSFLVLCPVELGRVEVVVLGEELNVERDDGVFSLIIIEPLAVFVFYQDDVPRCQLATVDGIAKLVVVPALAFFGIDAAVQAHAYDAGKEEGQR